MGRYGYAESLLSILSFVAWLGIGLGVVGGLYLGFASEDAFLLFIVVVPAVISGVTLLALAQVGRAILDIAANSDPVAQWAGQRLDEERQRQMASAAAQPGLAGNRVRSGAPFGGWKMAAPADDEQSGAKSGPERR